MTLFKRIFCLAMTCSLIVGSTSVSFADTTNAKSTDQKGIEALNAVITKNKSLSKSIETNSTSSKKEDPMTRAVTSEEVEANDSFDVADILEYGEKYKGYMNDSGDRDIFEIEMPYNGVATVEMYSIPSDCDYDMYVFDEDFGVIGESANANDDDEVIEFDVLAGEEYYVLICSYDGYSESNSYYVTVDIQIESPYHCASVGVDYYPNVVDTTDDARRFANDLEDIGYIKHYAKNVDYDDLTDDIAPGKSLLEADVLMLAGHGNADGIYFNYEDRGGDYAVGVKSGTDAVFNYPGQPIENQTTTTFQMIGLNNYDLEDTVLAVLCGCSTAKGGISSFAHLMNSNHGVDCVIGWKDTIQDPDAEIWLDYFGEALANGDPIVVAVAEANNAGPWVDEDTIVGELEIISESVDAHSLSLAEYAMEGASRRTLSTHNNTKELEDTVEKNRNYYKIDVDEMIHYDEENNFDEIVSYIKENIDSNFNIDCFETKTNLSNVICNGEVVSTAISMKLKNGEFVTENGYYIVVNNGIVDTIYVKGNPEVNETRLTQTYNYRDEEALKDDALKKIELSENEEVESQKVLKRFDTEPYYGVVTYIHNSVTNFDRSEYTEYR